MKKAVWLRIGTVAYCSYCSCCVSQREAEIYKYCPRCEHEIEAVIDEY